ncbi:MAG: hypothetical protein ACX98W_14875 [bacterium]
MSAHWPIDPVRAERLLERGRLRILATEHAGRGVTGARRVDLALLEPRIRITAKWKPSTRRLDAFNNSPRREIAAYEVQKLFLDPRDYVIPTSRLRCLRPGEFAGGRRIRETTVRGANCRIGVLSIWLQSVTLPDEILDRERFLRRPDYARRLADFNLAMYLIEHADGRRGNFLISAHGLPPRVFSVDNGVSFGGFLYNWFVPNWKKLRVPALREASIDRLRRLTHADVERLGVVGQLEWRRPGHLVNVPHTRNLDPEEGLRLEGGTIQIGLDEDEIEDLWRRIEHLRDAVDQGRVDVF